MDKKQAWIALVEEKSHHYLTLGDGGFDDAKVYFHGEGEYIG